MLQILFLLFFTKTLPVEQAVEQHKVVVNITHLRSAEGSIRMGIYTDNKSFEEKRPYLQKSFEKANAKKGIMRVELLLPEGTYGIALLDDENNNGKMDYGWVMPEEGFGFSNYWHTGMSKPDMEAFSFVVGAKAEVVKIKVKYL